jgi:low temperature requirement protein LtrA
MDGEGEGKRVSWVELYLDLIFVLAVGQLSHLIVSKPEMHTVWVALGLFFTLWWTWIGFAVLYNRFGVDKTPQRLLFLAGSIPTGTAAVAIQPASTGDITAFAISLAVTRLVLAAANGIDGGWRQVLRGRLTVSYLISVVLFVGSIWVPEPFRYVLWFLAITLESGSLLHDDRKAMRRAREQHDWSAMAPENPAERLDPHHFAERFGLFIIILLGEVVAAALWWLYFDAAAEINLKVFELSGGSPTMARGLFAIGHMIPAFALLAIASGVGLLLEGEAPEAIAYTLPALGIGFYLLGTRVFMVTTTRAGGAARVLLLIATFSLGRFHDTLNAHEYLWLLTAWTVICAALASRAPESDLEAARERRYEGTPEPTPEPEV